MKTNQIVALAIASNPHGRDAKPFRSTQVVAYSLTPPSHQNYWMLKFLDVLKSLKLLG